MRTLLARWIAVGPPDWAASAPRTTCGLGGWRNRAGSVSTSGPPQRERKKPCPPEAPSPASATFPVLGPSSGAGGQRAAPSFPLARFPAVDRGVPCGCPDRINACERLTQASDLRSVPPPDLLLVNLQAGLLDPRDRGGQRLDGQPAGAGRAIGANVESIAPVHTTCDEARVIGPVENIEVLGLGLPPRSSGQSPQLNTPSAGSCAWLAPRMSGRALAGGSPCSPPGERIVSPAIWITARNIANGISSSLTGIQQEQGVDTPGQEPRQGQWKLSNCVSIR